MMLHKIRLLIIYTLLVGPASLLNAEEPPAGPGQQLLLLRNGQALEGQISRSGDVYRVALPDGEIRIKSADVELICKDFEEGYQRKQAAIPVGSLREHLDLAQWCQRHKLYDYAAAELADAAAIAPENPMVGFLQRRLQMTIQPPPERPKPEASGEQPLSNEELDRMIRGLPHKAIENFTQSVQPLLMNNCTLSGCHGPQSETGLRLQRISLGQPAGRRLTQRNIYAVMKYVDRNNPLTSRILTVPTAPHGTSKTAVFTGPQAMQYKRLVDWVMQLGPAAGPESPATVPNDEPMLAETAPEAEPSVKAPRVLAQDVRKARPLPTPKHAATQATFQEPLPKPDEADISPDSESQRSKIKRGASQPEFTPKDSFDPEIFNRRYSKPTAPESSAQN